jgi:hypothetical protein
MIRNNNLNRSPQRNTRGVYAAFNSLSVDFMTHSSIGGHGEVNDEYFHYTQACNRCFFSSNHISIYVYNAIIQYFPGVAK